MTTSNSISLEETNKLRIQLGLDPLADDVDDNASAESEILSEDSDYDNRDDVHLPDENITVAKKTRIVEEKLERLRDHKKLQEKFGNVQSLGESGASDIKSWIGKIDQNKKIEEDNQIIESKPIHLENAYTEQHVTGLKVEHDINDFAEDRDVILTLKDEHILDKDGINMNEDVLVNVNMIDNEKHLENVLKKKSVTGNGYNPYADDGTEAKEDILAKYNEEIDGKTIKSFKIGDSFENFDASDKEDNAVKIKRNLQSLEEDMISPPSDYFSKAELSLKKRKSSTKKQRKLKKSAEEVIDREQKINVDELSSLKDIDRARPVIKIADESNFEPQSNVIDKLSQMKQLEKENTEESDLALNDEDKLELDLNHEFVLNLDVDREKQKALSNVRDDDNKDQMSLKDLKDQNAESILFNQHIANDNQSISNVIMFAKNQGLIDKQMQNIKYSEENKQIADNIKSKKFEKVEKNTDDALQLKFPSSSSRMRYQTVDFNDKSQYNPNISLQYFDEGGREVNNKEAFKILSHKFHGKWPGKKKEEKRMRKLAGQHLTAFSSLTDTPLHTVDKMRKKLESTKEPCIFLSKRHK